MIDNETAEFEIIALTFFKNWHMAAEKYELTDQQYGEVIRAMCNYCFFGKDTDLKGYGGAIFDMSKASIAKSNRDKMNGSTGGKKARGNSGARPGNDNAGKKKA
jgi:hypothetical protein